MPLNGFAPTHLWEPGESFLDEYQIPLPAEMARGNYEVRVGLYTAEGGRLPVSEAGRDTGDVITIAVISIN